MQDIVDVSAESPTYCMLEESADKIRQRNKPCKTCLTFCRQNALLIFALVGVVVGFSIGFAVQKNNPSEQLIMWIGMPGEIYLRLLKMTIVPLVVSSIISGTSALDARLSGKLGIITVAYMILTNTMGSLYAIIWFFIIRPGGRETTVSSDAGLGVTTHLRTDDMFADLLRNAFPDNLVGACFRKTQTKYSMINSPEQQNSSDIRFVRYQGTADSANILGLIVVSALFGIAVTRADSHVRKLVIDIAKAMEELIRIILNWVICLIPIGVASLIAASVAKVDNIQSTFESLGLFMLTHTLGNFFHELLVVPVVYFVFLRKNPLKFLGSTLRALVTVFAPPSTAVGLPELIKCAEDRNTVDPRVSRFVVPLGVALERLGSCIFICLSALFILTLEGKDIYVVDVLMVGFLTTAGSLALPAVPSGSLVTVLVVLTPFNISTEKIGLLMALEWYNDRIRSVNNSLTILLGTVIINRFCEKQLAATEETKDNCNSDAMNTDC